MESTRPEPIEASGNKYNHQVSERGSRRPQLEDASSSSHHLSEPSPEKISDGFYKFYEPNLAHAATLDIVFFHGLECEGSNLRDAYKSSSTSTVIKNLCTYAHNKKEKSVGGSDMSMFLDSIRGFFFYATPHLGIEGIEALAEDEGPLKWMHVLNSESARLHEAFSELWRARSYRWTISGLGEVESTRGSKRGRLHVREASSRFGDNYITVSSDHFSVCRPSDKNSNKYQHLKHLIEHVQKHVELERSQSLMVPKVTVGVDVLVNEVLGRHLRYHRFVGFSGLGGVGKTTLAKIIFNKVCAKFEFTCFMEEIKLISGMKEEIKKKVWEKMCHHGRPVQNSSESSRDGWNQVVGKSMFLVFDDIEDHRHVDLLQEIADSNGMDESRFLLTSRDTQRLRDCGDAVHIIPLDHLDDHDAKKLFTTYAFPNQEPPGSFEGIIQEIVVGCGGLPLTLEVLGKYLRSEPKEEVWAEIPIALRKCEDIADLEQRAWAKLKLSYDKLPGDEVKNMFLDIACFFILDLDWSADDAMKAWSVIYTSVHNRVKLLEERSLLKISLSKDHEGFDYMEFHLHEHVRRMGQRIAQQEGRSYNLRCSFLQMWKKHDEIISQEGKELGETVALITEISANLRRVFAQDCASCIMRQVWPKLTAIQYMTLKVDVTNCCSQCKNLKVVLPSTLLLLRLSLPKLRDTSLKFDINSVDYMRGILSWAAFLLLRLLTRRDIFVDHIGRTLSLATCTSLVRLEVSGFMNLGDLSKLQQLRILEIFDCSVAGNWATSLGELKILERLSLFGIEEPFELPISFGRLTRLQYLWISGCKVTSIPASFRNLTSLQVLEVKSIIGRQVIPIRSFRQMRSLKMTCWAIADLVDVFRELIALEELALHCEGISELPATLGNLTLLKKLSIKCPVKMLPDSLGNLTNLTDLEVENCPIQRLPKTLGQLSSLRSLIVRLCENLKTIPDSIGDLSSLWSLEVGSCKNLKNFPDSIGDLSSLWSLEVGSCKNLKTIPDSIGDLTSLKKLGITGSALHSLPDTIKNLSQLEYLDIRHCKNLKTLPDWIGDLTSLRELGITGSALHSLPDTIKNLPQLKLFSY
ncbi:hypothetical protein R1flu_003660 [Riccia fluitans]|uniref:NB-ARC domain-containing protein n=1 Tax=Riccia fluitans TaxID=41844 RepID=A0ABD1Y9S2_9MARC